MKLGADLFLLQRISGCSGTATGVGVNSYTTGAVTANCTVTATLAALPPAVVTTPNEWMLPVLALHVPIAATRRLHKM